MATSVSTRLPRQLSAGDLERLGARCGIAYRFPALADRAQGAQTPILRGRVDELELRRGIYLTRSDLTVLEPYASRSLAAAPLFITVILDGRVRLRLGEKSLWLSPGQALCSRFDDRQALDAWQDAGQRLRTLNLAFRADALAALAHQYPPLKALQDGPPVLRRQTLPNHLLDTLEEALASDSGCGDPRLLLDAVMLQLLARVLTNVDEATSDDRYHPPTATIPGLSNSERERLARVRKVLDMHPEADHRLADLARLAAMSPSSLRAKFAAAHGQSVFAYLRGCRLTKAARLLEQGLDVQQTAHAVGYGHASNFTTAFRRHFGMSPRAYRNAA
ncbi:MULTISPECIES: helix-turn-helix transcriptional regulator [Halomonadaceae]|uniref:helix-turn-helix transcriptional regulator n=1 Tax=Halomonadaceae TaxID=28256 RepID=UPI00158271FE|nr:MULTISPECIES: helix-turn-helix transcriptional regulator [Halomonas]MDI4636944.1 helix-turn-helix transcriptional regulator [Halomonas sp. BMC7]NUJ58111.1 helix-turn-helix transcriptional regulator [Halomonas taeanensis]